MNAGCRCAHYNIADYLPTLRAADQVAGEFHHTERVAFLADAVTKDHPKLPNQVAKIVAEMFVEEPA